MQIQTEEGPNFADPSPGHPPSSSLGPTTRLAKGARLSEDRRRADSNPDPRRNRSHSRRRTKQAQLYQIATRQFKPNRQVTTFFLREGGWGGKRGPPPAARLN